MMLTAVIAFAAAVLVFSSWFILRLDRMDRSQIVFWVMMIAWSSLIYGLSLSHLAGSGRPALLH